MAVQHEVWTGFYRWLTARDRWLAEKHPELSVAERTELNLSDPAVDQAVAECHRLTQGRPRPFPSKRMQHSRSPGPGQRCERCDRLAVVVLRLEYRDTALCVWHEVELSK
jgi:hypothetical protein